MSQSTYELIGRIINPRPTTAPAPRAAAVPPGLSVAALIGRIIHPYGPPGIRAERVASPPVGLIAVEQQPATTEAEPLPPA